MILLRDGLLLIPDQQNSELLSEVGIIIHLSNDI